MSLYFSRVNRVPVGRILLISLLSLGAGGWCRAAASPQSLGEYLQQAQDSNPELKAFAARYEAARARIPQASALPDPLLQVTHFVESVQTRTGTQDNVYMLAQKLPWFGRLKARTEAVSVEAEALQFAFEARQLILARRVSVAFYDYAYTGKAIALTRESLGLFEALTPQIEARVRTGGDLNALLRVQVEEGKLRDQLASLEQVRSQQSARLSALLASPDDTLFPWPAWTPTQAGVLPDQGSLLEAVATNNPELLMLERKVASSRVRVQLARLEGRPDVTLGVTYVQVGPSVMSPGAADSGRDPWGVSLAVNLPVWNKRNAGVRQEASALQRVAELELLERKNQLRSETLVALSAHRDAIRRIALYEKELLPLARQAVENTRASYEGGRASLLELIDSERSLLGLELLLWRAQADRAQQQIVMQTLANKPL